MAQVQRNQQIVTVGVSKAELVQLLGVKAREAGLINFDPDFVNVIETDSELGLYEVIFEREIIPAGGA